MEPRELDLGLDAAAASGGPLQIVSSRMGHLGDTLCRAYDVIGTIRPQVGTRVFR